MHSSLEVTNKILTGLKNIRIDHYWYRLRKGRADILLVRVDGTDQYCMPFQYVKESQRIHRSFNWCNVEDDGDLVINEIELKPVRKNRGDKEWIPLKDVLGLNLLRNESLHIYHNIFRFFLRICPGEGASGVKLRVEEMLDAVKVDIAKKAYVNALQRVLDGHPIMVMDAYYTQPDLDLLRKEIETLEHFRLHKPLYPEMNQKDCDMQRDDLYSFEKIDWTAFGAEQKIIPLAGNLIPFTEDDSE